MERLITGFYPTWSLHALRAALMILPLSLLGCAEDKKIDPPPAATFDLFVSVTGSGSVSSSPAGIDCGNDCAEALTAGSNITLSALPASGFTFTGWSGACSGSTSCALTLDTHRAVTATFTATPIPAPVQHTLTVSVTGSGSVSSMSPGITCGADCSENYTHDSNVALTASPGMNQQFSGWLGACSGTTTTCTVIMTEARNITATFAPIPAAQFTLTVSVTGSGSVASSPAGISCGSDCTESYASGQSVTLTATAGSGFQFSSWGGACSGNGACVVAMNMSRAVTATFNQTPPLSGDISISGTFAHGTQVTLTGSGFGPKSPAAPLVWATFEPGQGADSNDRNPTTKGRRASWDIFQSASMLSTALAPANSTQALRMDMARDTGWPPAAPADFADSFGAQISLAPADAGVIYMRGKIYKDWHITEICQRYNICSINDKMWRTWRSDGSSSNQVITNMYSNWHHNPLADGRVTTENAGNVAPCAQWTDRPYPFRQWNTDEWWYRRSSGANVSDGALRFVMNNVVHAEMLACVNLTSADPIGSTDFGIYEDFANVPNVSPRPVGWWTYFKDVYMDTTWSRVVVADSANYASATSTEIQIPVAWSDTGITIEVNQGAFASFTGKYVFVFNSQNQVVGFTQIP